MSLLDTINKNYKVNKESLETRGLQDSNYWDGLWIRPYVKEYLADGSLNPEFANFRNKPFCERGYVFLGHGSNLSFNLTGENTEITVDSTKEKLYLKGSSSLEISVELLNKFNKLFAKLGVSGTLLEKTKQVKDLPLGWVQTSAVSKSSLLRETSLCKEGQLKEDVFEINCELDLHLLRSFDSLKFSYGTGSLSLKQVKDLAQLANDTFFFNQKANSILFKLSPANQKEGKLHLSYTGEIDEVLVGYGGESRELKTFNIVQIYNDPASGKVSYREAFKCVASPTRNMSFRGQNSTDGGSTQSITFTASEDITRPAGEQLFIEKDDWDLSLSV